MSAAVADGSVPAQQAAFGSSHGPSVDHQTDPPSIPHEDSKEEVNRTGTAAPPPAKATDTQGLSSAEAAKRLEEYGRNESVHEVTPKWKIFLSQFWGLLPFMIEVAALLALIAQDWVSFAIIAVILAINAVIGYREETKAQDSIEELKGGMTSKCSVMRDGKAETIDAAEIVPGDVVFLKGGQAVPADGVWMSGDILQVDTSALTGETFPRKVPEQGQESGQLLSGYSVKQGECYMLVEKTGEKTEMGSATAFVAGNAGTQPGFFEKKILAFVKIVVAITLMLCIVCIIVQVVAYKQGANKVLISVLTIIIASVPIALPVVMKITQALGALQMAKEHAIVTHLAALQEIASMSVLCSDKTGTLTTAQITIFPDLIWMPPGAPYTADEILEMAAICSNPNNLDDPIDAAVIKSWDSAIGQEEAQAKRAQWDVEKYHGFNPTVKRTIVLASKNGEKYIISKGLAPKVVRTGNDEGELNWTVENADKLESLVHKADEDLSKKGYKTIAVAVSRAGGPWQFAGVVPMLDPPRKDTKDTIAAIRDAGIRIKMITGDHANIARELAKLVGLGANICPCTDLTDRPHSSKQLINDADGFAQALPKDKIEVVAALQDMGWVVGMTGDGVNDAPALSQADIGVAVEGATDAARSAADIVLTAPGLSAIYTAVVESRRIFRRIKTYIVYRMASTVQLVIFLVVLILAYDEPLDPIYVILLAALNDISTITLAYDKASPSKGPNIPTLGGLILTSGIYGIALLAEALIFYEAMPHILGGTGYRVGHTGPGQGAAYLQLAVSMLLLLFSTRSNTFVLLDMPAWGLVLSVFCGLVFSTLFAGLGAIDKISWRAVGIIWGYDLAWFIAIDICKVFINYFLAAEEVLDVHTDIGEPKEDNKRASARTSTIMRASRASSAERKTQEGLERLSGRQAFRGFVESHRVRENLRASQGSAARFSSRTPAGIGGAMHHLANQSPNKRRRNLSF